MAYPSDATRRSSVLASADSSAVSTTALLNGPMSVNVAQERNNNVFLRAIRPGMALHLELDRCRPINAVLVPSCQVLDDQGIDESMMSAAFLRAHCLRSLSKGKTSFITVLGQKGDFSPDMNTVTVGSRRLSVLRRMPLDVQAGYAVAEELPDVYIVSDLACSMDDVRAEDARTTRAKSSFVGVDDDAPPSSFKEFQLKLQDRRLKHVAKNMKAFLTQQLAPEHPFTPQAVRLFIDTTAEELLKVDIWGAAHEASKYREEVYEDLERYIMTKLYDRCVQAIADPAANDALSARIGLLAPWVQPKHMCVPDTVVASKFWRQAVAAMSKVSEFKAPRDKIVCLLNCITYLSQAAKKADADVGADVLHPAIIYCVAHANPKCFLDHLKFILLYRWKEKVRGEAQYYLSILQGAVAFWQTCTARELSMDPRDFESALAGKAPPPQLLVTRPSDIAALPASSSTAAVPSVSSNSSASANNTPKKVVPAGRIAIVDDEEQRRRETWDTSFGSRTNELKSKWEVDTITQKSAEDEINVSLAQIDRQLDAELQLLRSAAKAEEAVETSRLHGWHSVLMQREAGLGQTHHHLASLTKKVKEFVTSQIALVDEHTQVRRQQLDDLAAEHDRRLQHAEVAINESVEKLTEQFDTLQRRQHEWKAQVQADRAATLGERRTNEEWLDQRMQAVAKREADFKAYVEREQTALAERQTALEKREKSFSEFVKTCRTELEELEKQRKESAEADSQALSLRTAELDRREALLKAQTADFAASVESHRKHVENRDGEMKLQESTVQQLVSQRQAELDDQEKKLQTRIIEVDRLSKASQEAHARREAELNRRTTELESSLETSRSTIARRAADLTRHAQMNQEQLAIGMQEVNRLRAEGHQRMVEDRATFAGIQANLDERHSALSKREVELQSKMKEALDSAKDVENAARQSQRSTIAECSNLCKEGVARIEASDFLGQVSGYDNLKISDLQNLWKTMDALRALKLDFQSKTESLTQLATTIPQA